MSYLKTVVTYHQPSEAEVDKAFLESHGFNVCLLNANTSRNELGAPFYIQLQAMDEDFERATAILREANPGRFGSPALVDELDRRIRRSTFLFLGGAIPLGVAFYFLTPAPTFTPNRSLTEIPPMDLRPLASLVAAFLGGALTLIFGRKDAAAAPRSS